jgi:hypothetical protein
MEIGNINYHCLESTGITFELAFLGTQGPKLIAGYGCDIVAGRDPVFNCILTIENNYLYLFKLLSI